MSAVKREGEGLSATLIWLWLLWPVVSPLLVAPGQTRAQVEALLGEEPYTVWVRGGNFQPSIIYIRARVVVHYGAEGRVESVFPLDGGTNVTQPNQMRK